MARTRGASRSWAMTCFRKPTFFATASTKVTRDSGRATARREAREPGSSARVEEGGGPRLEGPKDGQRVENVLVRDLDWIEDGRQVDAGAPPAELPRQPGQRVSLGLGEGQPERAAPLQQHSRNRWFLHRHSETYRLELPETTRGSRWHVFSPGLPQRGLARSQRHALAGRCGQVGARLVACSRRIGAASPEKSALLCHVFDRNTRALVDPTTLGSSPDGESRFHVERGPSLSRGLWDALRGWSGV